MQTQTYESILERLDRGIGLCSRIGLSEMVKESRFTQYRQWLTDLIRIVHSPAQGALTSTHREHLIQHADEYRASLVESAGFGDVMEHLNDVDKDILRPKLEDILRGPFLPKGEDHTSNLSRNVLFELRLASVLKRARFLVQLAVHPDVRCSIDSTTVFFECKRPYSENKVARRITEAGAQLLKNVKAYGPPDTLGMIVISVAKLFNREQKPIPALNDKAAMKSMDESLMNVVNGSKESWRKFEDTKAIAGILFHLDGLFENAETGRYDSAQWWIGVRFPNSNGTVVDKLAESLTALSK